MGLMGAVAAYQQIDAETLARIRRKPSLIEGIISPEGYSHADGGCHSDQSGNIGVEVDHLGMNRWQEVDSRLPTRAGMVILRKGVALPATEIRLSEEAVRWKDPRTGSTETCTHAKIARLALDPLLRHRLQDARRASHINEETLVAFALFLGLVYVLADKVFLESAHALRVVLVLLGLLVATSLVLAVRAFATSERYVEFNRRQLRKAGRQVADPIDIDKAWEHLEPALRTLSPPNDGDASGAIGGGTEIGDDVGYGPARCLEPREVQDLAAALSRIDGDALLAAQASEVREYVAEHFSKLKGYFADAASRGAAMLLWKE
jgi:hypothetical protein